ncbi:hypothetical protein EBZ80_12565 [bacterium]|nr:hypothetical protein [bacterium]
MSGLLLVNAIVPQISLPTKGTFSNNTIPFVLNYFPTQLTGTGLVSKTALDYYPPQSFTQNTPRVSLFSQLRQFSAFIGK